LVVAVTTSCGESTGPNGTAPGINVIAGANVSDTIDAVLPQPLRVVIRDQAGGVLAGAIVRFSSVPLGEPVGPRTQTVLVGDLGNQVKRTFRAETTSAEGATAVRITMGDLAGAAGVEISVPEAGLVDTVRYTVLPGLPARVILPVEDTTVQVGRSFALGGRVEDRYYNRRPEAVTYALAGQGISISAGQVGTSVPARAAVVGRLDGSSIAPDTTWVSVVPAATILVRRNAKFVTGPLDGTAFVEIPHNLEASDFGLEWQPDGESFLALLGTFATRKALYRVSLNGSMQLLASTSGTGAGGIDVPGVMDGGFTGSPDGQWVYMSAGNCNFNEIIYRLHLTNPQSIQRLSPPGGDECFQLVNKWPSPSPDGTRLAFENQTGNRTGYSVRILTIANRSVSEIAPGGQRPQWAPSGELIAYTANDQIWTIRSDGSGARALSPPGRKYVPGVKWSPDGQWIFAAFEPREGWAGTTVTLLNVNTGLEIPLSWTTGYGNFPPPVWKP
jgi:Tol biopolymer transport system component